MHLPLLSLQEQQVLLKIARDSIRNGTEQGRALDIDARQYYGKLEELGAAFVTLEKAGQLRGCIGSVEAYRPLVEDVAENAWYAAFKDHRFSPLSKIELDQILIEISILTQPEVMDVSSEAELKAQLVPEQDGLILEDGYRRALFLPAVWEKLPSTHDFIAHLKQKAGMPTGHWSPTMKASRFTSFEFSETHV